MSSQSVLGLEHLPAGGFLLVPDPLVADDIAVLHSALAGRPLTFLVEHDAILDPSVHHAADSHGELIGFVPDDAHLNELRHAIADQTGQGRVVLFLPGAAPARPSSRLGVPGARLILLQQAADAVVPLAIDRPSQSHLPIEQPASLPSAVYSFGRATGANDPAGQLLRHHLEAGEVAFSQRALLDDSLGWALLRGLKAHHGHHLHDALDGSDTSYGQLLAAALVLARHLRTETQAERVAIVLPPGRAGMIANLGVVLAGKVPVNLNFTAGNAAIRSAIRQARVDRFITADPFVRKNQGFPWPPNKQLVLLERLLPAKKKELIRTFLMTKVLPAAVLARLFQVERSGGSREAVLLFTSGSSGEPKGVALTHRNVLGNLLQIGTRLGLHGEGDRIVGCLPLFHSFGATVTLWFPVVQGLGVVTYPSPLEVAKIAELVHDQKAALLVTTPTFLRGYLKRAKPEQLASLKLVVTGAEKLPASLAREFQNRFGMPVLEGYGLTETTPVTNVNLPEVAVREGEGEPIPSLRPGSVGQLVSGLSVRITEADGDVDQSVLESGMIWLRGVNVFNGYLDNKAKTREVLQDGWFRTGDIGRLDEDGFLYIEGRLSRFSKIGGEMVPHERVEEEISRALGLTQEEERKIAVVGVPDDDKGEALVLLSTVAGDTVSQELIDLRYRLLEAGIPSLWIPKKLVRAREIPVLASGKLDIRGCEELAKLA